MSCAWRWVLAFKRGRADGAVRAWAAVHERSIITPHFALVCKMIMGGPCRTWAIRWWILCSLNAFHRLSEGFSKPAKPLKGGRCCSRLNFLFFGKNTRCSTLDGLPGSLPCASWQCGFLIETVNKEDLEIMRRCKTAYVSACLELGWKVLYINVYMYHPLRTPTTSKKMLTKISCSVLQWECLSDSALTLGWLP